VTHRYRVDQPEVERIGSSAHESAKMNSSPTLRSSGAMGDHPIIWCKSVGAGRSLYTGLGHTGAALAAPMVQRHLLGGILYAAGAIAADCSSP